MNWYKFALEENEHYFELCLEVDADKVIRQVERYDECWVYSGAPLSFCPRADLDGSDAFGNLTLNLFSEISDDMLLVEVDESYFQEQWQKATILSQHQDRKEKARR